MPKTTKTNWGSRPARVPDQLDDFVAANGRPRTKRLNTCIPAELHARVKAGCALEGRDMTEVLTELLEQRFPKRPT